jgi:SAM-dependent methyltransferase
MPIQQDIHMAYETYSTHEIDPIQFNGIRRIDLTLKTAYLKRRYGYNVTVPAWARLAAVLFPWIHPGGKREIEGHSVYLPKPPKEGVVLEVGCGNGDNLHRLKTLGWTVMGMDVDADAIRLARSRGIDVRFGDLVQVQLPASSVDAIILHHVIEHLHNPRETLRECMRVLRPGGRLVVVTPNSRSLGHRTFGYFWVSLDPPRHLILFTLKSLTGLLQEEGWKLERTETTPRGARSCFHLSLELVRRRQPHPYSRPGWVGRVFSIGFQVVERFSLLFEKNIGEEIVTVAQKVSV